MKKILAFIAKLKAFWQDSQFDIWDIIYLCLIGMEAIMIAILSRFANHLIPILNKILEVIHNG